MAYEGPGKVDLGNHTAGADLRTHQYKFVKLNSAGQVVLCATLGERPFGVLQNKPKLGQSAAVRTSGVSKVLVAASQSIDEGTPLGTDANARAVAAATGNTIAGTALTDPGATVDEVFTMNVQIGGVA